MNSIKPFLPHYHRPPNKFVRYYEKRFDDGAGHTATLRIAVFLNKKGKEEECVAQVMWDEI
jgi:hypothetical protein